MISVILSRLVLLVCGTLYPAYASYKTVKTKNVRDYVHWMMYWIVFAGYTFVEIFTDIFLSFWFPFYYELKIIFVLWLVCPSRGSTYLFRKVINPQMSKYESVIDSYVAATWIHGYDFIRKIGAQGVEYLIEIIFELLRKGQITVNTFMPEVPADAQNIVAQNIGLHKKHSVSDVTEIDEDFISMTDNSEVDEAVPSSITDNPPSESCSESEETSEKTQSSKIKTRSKKVTSVRERRKIMK